MGPGMLGASFDSLGLDFVVLGKVDEVLDLLARSDELRLRYAASGRSLAPVKARFRK
jgi:hypothetical protein